MAYLSVGEFQEILLTTPLDRIVEEHLFQGMPYVFREKPTNLDLLKGLISSPFGCSRDNIIVVGSAKLGFSLNPENFPRTFSDESDIDVIVVDEKLFDHIWMILLKWNYPRRLQELGKVEGNWMRLRRKEVYWGWFTPHEILYEGIVSFPEVLKPLRNFSTLWFNTFQSLSLYPEFARRTVAGRLYRSWGHAHLYHEDGLRQVRNILHSRRTGLGEQK